MKPLNFSSGTKAPGKKVRFASFIFNSIHAVLTGYNAGFVTLSQVLFYLQWTHSVFKASDNFPGLLFSEKYLLRYKAQKAANANAIDEFVDLNHSAQGFIEKAKVQQLYKPSHTKTMAVIYWYLGITYQNIGSIERAIENFETAEKMMFELLQTYPDYESGFQFLDQIQDSIAQLTTISDNA